MNASVRSGSTRGMGATQLSHAYSGTSFGHTTVVSHGTETFGGGGGGGGSGRFVPGVAASAAGASSVHHGATHTPSLVTAPSVNTIHTQRCVLRCCRAWACAWACCSVARLLCGRMVVLSASLGMACAPVLTSFMFLPVYLPCTLVLLSAGSTCGVSVALPSVALCCFPWHCFAFRGTALLCFAMLRRCAHRSSELYYGRQSRPESPRSLVTGESRSMATAASIDQLLLRPKTGESVSTVDTARTTESDQIKHFVIETLQGRNALTAINVAAAQFAASKRTPSESREYQLSMLNEARQAVIVRCGSWRTAHSTQHTFNCVH